jgi:hypothetical protein
VTFTSRNLTNQTCRLITEWRIQKRVDEQFNAFVQGFHELIPADLVNVFDERELELLIGGIADIDVDDWKKHTDYRGYTESDPVVQNFWKVSNKHLKQSSAYESNTNKRTHRSSVAGTPSRSLVSSSSPPVPRVSPSTVSRTCKAPMALAASPSRSQARRPSCPSRTRASTVSTCRPTRPTTCSRRSSRGLLRRRSVSDRSKVRGVRLVFPYGEASVEKGGKMACVPFLLSTH